MLNSQKNYWLALFLQDVLIVMESTWHGVWGDHLQWWCYVFIHLPTWPQIQHGSLHTSSAWRRYSWPGLRGWLLEDFSQQDSVPSHTNRWTQSWLWENFCNHITLNIWLPSSPSLQSPWLLWAVDQKTNKTLSKGKDLDNSSIYQFKQWERKTCRRFQSHQEAVVKVNGDFFEWIFTTGPKTGVQSQVESYQRLTKWFLMPPCLTLSLIR